MILKYIGEKNGSLNCTTEYRVLSIDHVCKQDESRAFMIKYRILNDKGIASLYDVDKFEVVNPSIEHDFVYKSYENGNYELVPSSMSYPFFWESFFDDEEKAMEVFLKRFPEFKDEVF